MTNESRKVIELTISADIEQAAMIRATAAQDLQVGGSWRCAYDKWHDSVMTGVKANLKILEETLL